MNEPQPPSKMTHEQLKLIALKQRIGEITSQYEDQIADMRASFTQQLESMNEALKNNDITIENLQNQLRNANVPEKKEDSDSPSE